MHRLYYHSVLFGSLKDLFNIRCRLQKISKSLLKFIKHLQILKIHSIQILLFPIIKEILLVLWLKHGIVSLGGLKMCSWWRIHFHQRWETVIYKVTIIVSIMILGMSQWVISGSVFEITGGVSDCRVASLSEILHWSSDFRTSTTSSWVQRAAYLELIARS